MACSKNVHQTGMSITCSLFILLFVFSVSLPSSASEYDRRYSDPTQQPPGGPNAGIISDSLLSEKLDATEARKACGSGPKIAADLWKEYERRTKVAGCYIDWAPSSKERFAACLGEYSKLPYQIFEEMIGFWNSMAENKWSTIGPRRIEPGKNKGTLFAPGNRLWLTTTPEFMENISLEIKKRGGHSKTQITVCTTREDGSTHVLLDKTIDQQASGTVVNRKFPDPKPGILSVHMRSLAELGKTFKHTVKFETEPEKYYAGPVDGFADLHAHQMADEAYGGLWYWGDHMGLGTDALKADVRMNPSNSTKRLIKKAINFAEARGKEVGDEAMEFYTHAIPDIFTSDDHLNIAHGDPAPSSLKSWPRYDDIAHQQVNARWLKKAHENGLDLMVLSTVNFQAVCKAMRMIFPEKGNNSECGDMENVKRQLRAAQAMDKKYDWYEIAVHPWHARKIIDEGKLAVVLSMEVSNLFPKGEGDFIAQLEELRSMGLRTMQLAHETNSRFAGAAPHNKLFNHFEGLKHPLRGEWGFDLKNNKNTLGITKKGKRLAKTLIKHHMPIDIAHLSEKSTKELYKIAEKHDYFPLYNSHTRLKEILSQDTKGKQKEFLTTCKQAQYIEATGGMVGLRTGDTDLKTHFAEDENPVIENNCPGSSRSFAQLVQFGVDQTGLDMGFGTDFNGFITQLGPRFGPEACHRVNDASRTAYAQKQDYKGEVSDTYHRVGLSHIGYLPDLLADLDGLGADVRRLENSAEAFLKMWERAWSENRSRKDITTSCWTTQGGSWNDADARARDTLDVPDSDDEVDNLLQMDVKGIRGSQTISDYSLGKTIAGSFQREVSFNSLRAAGKTRVDKIRLRKAGWDTMGFLSPKKMISSYPADSTISTPGRYALEAILMNADDRTMVGHTIFRVVPNPDSIRAEVDFSLHGSQNVVSYDWSDQSGQYAFVHSRGTQGAGNSGGWTFREHMIPEAVTEDKSTVQKFYMEVDGKPVDPGDSVQTEGDHTLAIYACHNVLAGSCDDISSSKKEQEGNKPRHRYEKDKNKQERDNPKHRYEKPKKKKRKKKKDNEDKVAAGPLPPGVMLIARQNFSVVSDDRYADNTKPDNSNQPGGFEDHSVSTDTGKPALTIIPKGGFSMPGISSLNSLAEIDGLVQQEESPFAWGASVTLGEWQGFANIRLSALQKSGTITVTQDINSNLTTAMNEKFTAISADLVVRPFPRIIVQPYLAGGYGFRKISYDGTGDSWESTIPIAAGVDLQLGDNGLFLGMEIVDYLSDFSSEGNDLRHDAFIFGFVGIPLF